MKGILKLILVFTVFIYSCTERHSEGAFTQDFEDMGLWSNGNPLLSNSISHGGKYAAKMDSALEYSSTFVLDLDRIKSGHYKKAVIKVFALASNSPDGLALVASVDGPDKNYAWKSIPFKDVLKGQNLWSQIVMEIDLPQEPPAGTVLKVYGWNTKRQAGFLDDFEISFK